MSFKKTHTFEERKKEAASIMQKYPDRIPVIVERAPGRTDIPDIDKHKFLVPSDLTAGQFLYIIRKRLKLKSEQAIFLFVNNTLPPSGDLMSSIYRTHKEDCGYLFVLYTGESTFGL